MRESEAGWQTGRHRKVERERERGRRLLEQSPNATDLLYAGVRVRVRFRVHACVCGRRAGGEEHEDRGGVHSA